MWRRRLNLKPEGKRGVVRGISFKWLGPEGWPEWMAIRFGDQIKATEIIQSVSDDVHRARLWNLLGPLVAALILPPILLVLGIGIAWVRRGFASKT